MSSQFPYFIQENLIHFSDLHLSRKRRSTLVLLRNLQFYELCNNQILNFIDLQSSFLNKIHNQLDFSIPEVNGTQSQASDIVGRSIICPNYQAGGIMIGKYIYQNRANKIVYILVKCLDVMVVIKKDLNGFTLQAEYEHIHSFKVCKGNNYLDQLTISFNDCDKDVITNFQENLFPLSTLPKAETYRNILDKIKMKQSELLVHKTITKKDFAKLKSTDLFGCNFLRTPRLEEMQILSKCGNAWIKVTADDDIVIGVPLVNNCSTRLTTLRNLRAVLHGSENLNYYKFTLYQLSKRFCDIESIQSFFHSQNYDDQNDCDWSQCTGINLRPEAYGVLVIRIKISELFQLGFVQLPLFVFYDIVMTGKTFTQKCFVTSLLFREIYTNDACRLKFNEKHLQRDLLTVIATSYDVEVRLEYNTNGSALEDYLLSKMGFFKISRKSNHSETMTGNGQEEENDVRLEKVFFYNKNPDSVWHGTLFVVAYTTDTCSNVKLYTKTQEKSKVFCRLLGTELQIEFDIKEVCREQRNTPKKLIEFEGALRDECYSYIQMCSSNIKEKERFDISKKQSLQKGLHMNELKTDMIFRDLES